MDSFYLKVLIQINYQVWLLSCEFYNKLCCVWFLIGLLKRHTRLVGVDSYVLDAACNRLIREYLNEKTPPHL